MRWLALLLLVGCGDNLQGITLEQRYRLEANARCAQLSRCGLYPDESSCVAATRDRNDTALAAAVDSGVVAFNPFSEEECLRDIAAMSCDQTSRSFRIRPLSCQGALLGNRSPGQDCRFDTECLTARCTEGLCEPFECCQGTCKPARKLLGPCDDNSDCDETQYCNPDHTCAALEHELGVCFSDGACAFGLACIGASSVTAGTCRKLPAIGQSCPYGRCADIGAHCNTNMMCVRLGLPGDTCSDTTDCSPYAPCNQTSGRCEAIPSLGMACTARCSGNAACFNGTCVPPLEDGTPCLSSNDCSGGLCAEGMLGYSCMQAPSCF